VIDLLHESVEINGLCVELVAAGRQRLFAPLRVKRRNLLIGTLLQGQISVAIARFRQP
jgi:hypothetical protein